MVRTTALCLSLLWFSVAAASPAATTVPTPRPDTVPHTAAEPAPPQNARQDLPDVFAKLAPPPSGEALARIPDLGRKLLALRSYVRSRKTLAKRWSWTAAEIEAYQGSPEQEKLLAEVAAVSAHFARANPGYALYANTKVRSLDVQIERWNKSESVDRAAREIFAAWEKKFGGRNVLDAPADLEKMRQWLSGFRLSKWPLLAAPGLTRHGRAGAIDFQIMKGGEIFAGAKARHVRELWEERGWKAKLQASMKAAGPSFNGPLKRPNEPWHYEYEPVCEVDCQ